MKQLLLATFSVLLFLSPTVAQQPVIIGSVRSGDGNSLANAHILNINNRQGALTDGLGKFMIAVADTGAVLRISYVGFRPVLYTVTPEMLQSQERIKNISIVLSQESTLLSPAVVSSGTRTVINGKRGIVLRDFSFADGNNILLMAQDGIRYLVSTNENWKEQARLPVVKKGESLFEDCLGNVHLLGKDSVYQITVSSEAIQLSSATERSYFLAQMAHCSTSSDSYIFFSSYQKAGQEVYHYGLERETKKGVVLQRVFDHQGLQDIKDYFSSMGSNPLAYRTGYDHGRVGSGLASSFSYNDEHIYGDEHSSDNLTVASHNGNSGRYSHSGIGSFREQRRRHWRNFRFNRYHYSRSQEQYFRSVSNRNFEQQRALIGDWNTSPRTRGWLSLLSPPVYSPMFMLRDSIFVFDHVVGIANVYTEDGVEVRSFPIEHQEMNGWGNKLLPDVNGQKLYARIKRKGKVFLMEIDLTNGSILNSTYLKDAAFVAKLRIKDGYVYYLKEDRDILVSDRLVKQRL